MSLPKYSRAKKPKPEDENVQVMESVDVSREYTHKRASEEQMGAKSKGMCNPCKYHYKYVIWIYSSLLLLKLLTSTIKGTAIRRYYTKLRISYEYRCEK